MVKYDDYERDKKGPEGLVPTISRRGMIEDVTNRGIRRLRFARNPCEPVIETTSMLTMESRLLLVRILFRGG